MSNTELTAPADKRLMADFLGALEAGDTRALLDTPAFRTKRHTLGQILADEAGGDNGQVMLGCLLRPLARALKSVNTDERLQAMADASALARLFADTHAEAQGIADAAADDELQADYSDAFERASAFAGACFPTLRRGAA